MPLFQISHGESGKRPAASSRHRRVGLGPEATPGTERLMAGEERLHHFIPGWPLMTNGMYTVTRFSVTIVMQLQGILPDTINGSIVPEHSHCRDFAPWLQSNGPEFMSANRPAE